MTPAGLRSLFRHHRRTTGIQLANPHRFRHTFASDMVRAGISLPALMQLMGHADIETTTALCKGLAPGCLPAVCPRGGAVHPSSTEDCLVNALAPASTPASPGACLRACGRVSLRPHSPRPANVTTTWWCATSSSISARHIPRLLISTNCAVILISSDGCPACAPRIRPWPPHPTSAGSSLCAPSSTSWLGPTISLNSPTCCCARIFLALPHTLPRPLTAEQDQLLQQEFLRRNDLGGNVFLLLRSHRHAHRRMCRPVLRLPALHWPEPMGHPCSPRQTQNRTHGPRRCLRPRSRAPTALLSLPGSSTCRWTASGPSRQQSSSPAFNFAITCIRPATPLGLSTSIVPHQFRHTYATEMLRCRRQLSRPDEIARPRRSGA